MDVYSKLCNLLGGAGAGQHTKMVNQINIAGSMIGVCQGLIYAKKTGLDIQQVLDTISGGAAASFSLTAYAPRILKGDMAPGFYAEHFLKDLKIALEECESMKISLPGLNLVHDMYSQLVNEMDGGRYGTQALIRVLEKMNDVQI